MFCYARPSAFILWQQGSESQPIHPGVLPLKQRPSPTAFAILWCRCLLSGEHRASNARKCLLEPEECYEGGCLRLGMVLLQCLVPTKGQRYTQAFPWRVCVHLSLCASLYVCVCDTWGPWARGAQGRAFFGLYLRSVLVVAAATIHSAPSRLF